MQSNMVVKTGDILTENQYSIIGLIKVLINNFCVKNYPWVVGVFLLKFKNISIISSQIKVITKLPNSEQSSKGKSQNS